MMMLRRHLILILINDPQVKWNEMSNRKYVDMFLC